MVSISTSAIFIILTTWRRCQAQSWSTSSGLSVWLLLVSCILSGLFFFCLLSSLESHIKSPEMTPFLSNLWYIKTWAKNLDRIAVSVFVNIGWVGQILSISISIRTKDHKNHSDTQTGTLSIKIWPIRFYSSPSYTFFLMITFVTIHWMWLLLALNTQVNCSKQAVNNLGFSLLLLQPAPTQGRVSHNSTGCPKKSLQSTIIIGLWLWKLIL